MICLTGYVQAAENRPRKSVLKVPRAYLNLGICGRGRFGGGPGHGGYCGRDGPRYWVGIVLLVQTLYEDCIWKDEFEQAAFG